MTGFSIAAGAVLLFGVCAWLVYVYLTDPDILERMSAPIFRSIVVTGVVGLLLVVTPAIVSRDEKPAPAQAQVLTVRQVCDNLWAQFLESGTDDQFVLLAIYNKECVR